jgi:hypothetical protein
LGIKDGPKAVHARKNDERLPAVVSTPAPNGLLDSRDTLGTCRTAVLLAAGVSNLEVAHVVLLALLDKLTAERRCGTTVCHLSLYLLYQTGQILYVPLTLSQSGSAPRRQKIGKIEEGGDSLD